MPPAEDVFFGRSVAIEGEYAVVGADQYGEYHFFVSCYDSAFCSFVLKIV